eukprot:2389660-Rhodomonas_salina.1
MFQAQGHRLQEPQPMRRQHSHAASRNQRLLGFWQGVHVVESHCNFALRAGGQRSGLNGHSFASRQRQRCVGFVVDDHGSLLNNASSLAAVVSEAVWSAEAQLASHHALAAQAAVEPEHPRLFAP